MCCRCVDYLLTSLTITTSTHTNYFDQVVKEHRAQGPVESDYYTETTQLVNALSTLFSSLLPPSAPKQITEQALHYSYTTSTVNGL